MSSPRAAAPGASPGATIEFQTNWRQVQTGQVRQGEPLTLKYDPQRLPSCRAYHDGMPAWDIFGNARFLPSGQLFTGNLVQHTGDVAGGVLNPPRPVPFTVTVPPDATQAEVWFHNTDMFACSAFDSVYGSNYRFDVAKAGPAQPVMFRAGAEPSPEMVNVFSETPSKIRHSFGSRQSTASELETHLSLTVWVRNVAYQKNVWIDLHVFDPDDNLVSANTLTLSYQGSAGGNGDFFTLGQMIFQGSGGVSGSVWPRADARKVQYRLYYQVNDSVFTDGILHQHSIEADATVAHPVAIAA